MKLAIGDRVMRVRDDDGRIEYVGVPEAFKARLTKDRCLVLVEYVMPSCMAIDPYVWSQLPDKTATPFLYQLVPYNEALIVIQKVADAGQSV